jgi:hypothetical protein
MTVTVYARHGTKCSKSRDRNAGQYKRCKCPLWLRWGKHDKKSARTRSWDIATKAARKLEQELELKANGIELPKKPDYITIESAADLYLGDMAQRGIKDLSKARRMLSRLQDYANGKNIILLKDVTARLLTEWRSGWTFKKGSDSPAVHWSVVKTFFKWAFSIWFNEHPTFTMPTPQEVEHLAKTDLPQPTDLPPAFVHVRIRQLSPAPSSV